MLCVCTFSYFFNPWFINVSTLVATWYDIWPVIFSNKMTKTQNFKSRVANDGKNYHCYYQDQPVSHFDTCHFTEKWLFFHQKLWFKEIHSMDKSSLPTFSHQCWNFAAIWPLTFFFLSAPHPWVHLTLRRFSRWKTSSTPCMCFLSKAARATEAVSLSWRATLPVNAARYAVALFTASHQADQRGRVWSHWGRSLFTRHTRKIQSTLKHGTSAVELFTWSFKFKDLRAVMGTADRRSRYLCFMGLPGLGWRAVIVSSAALTYTILRGNRKWKRSV